MLFKTFLGEKLNPNESINTALYRKRYSTFGLHHKISEASQYVNGNANHELVT